MQLIKKDIFTRDSSGKSSWEEKKGIEDKFRIVTNLRQNKQWVQLDKVKT